MEEEEKKVREEDQGQSVSGHTCSLSHPFSFPAGSTNDTGRHVKAFCLLLL